MRILIQTIPHDQQRYETLGDYWQDEDGTYQVRVSEMPDWRYEILIVIHELAEFFSCLHAEIKEPDIKAFDELFEAERLAGLWTDEEPGNDPRAPYRLQHQFSERMIERPLADMLGVNWEEYESFCAHYDFSYASHMETEG